MRALAQRLVAALSLLVVVAWPAWAEPDYPAFTGLVVDQAHVLSDADKAALTQKLTDLQTKIGVQFAVVTVSSLGGDEIEPYANALFRKWGIGQKGIDNGLLLILAPNERKLRFEVGRGLEGTMTDLQTKLIQHNTMVPKLKAGDASGALLAGADDAIKVLNGDKSVARPQPNQSGQEDPLTFFLMFGFGLLVFGVIFLLIWRSSRRQGRWNRGGSGVAPWIIGSGIGSSSGSSWSSDSSSGGDSFGGGGGGDSGGGGSSDSY